MGLAVQVLHFIVIAGMREGIFAMAQDFSKGAAFPPDLAIAANFEGFPAAMLQKGQSTIRSYDSIESPG